MRRSSGCMSHWVGEVVGEGGVKEGGKNVCCGIVTMYVVGSQIILSRSELLITILKLFQHTIKQHVACCFCSPTVPENGAQHNEVR